MKIVVALDSFKGCCTSIEAANAVERGIRYYTEKIEIVKIPVADGGEGTVDALVKSLNGKYTEVNVLDPLGRQINAQYGLLPGKSAVIEMASSSGLPLLKSNEYNPLTTTTFGTGQLILDALDKGCRNIYIGLGGSATNDAGVGMAQALGVSFKNKKKQEIGFGGAQLKNIYEIDFSNFDKRIADTEIMILSDVTNPLCGKNGASHVYGSQKGATEEVINTLDSNLKYFATFLSEHLNIDIMDVPGSGAAGGLGAGLIAFCDAKIFSGVDKILDLINLQDNLTSADLVITGEGRMDYQTINGKLPVGVAKKAKKFGIPVIAIVGSVGEGAEIVLNQGIDAIIDIINEPMTLTHALDEGIPLIEKASEQLIRIWFAVKQEKTR